MPTLLVPVLVSIASFLFGAFVTRWWNRARPLVLLRGFDDITSRKDKVACPAEVAEATEGSWHSDSLSTGEVEMGDLQTCKMTSFIAVRLYENAVDEFPGLTNALNQAESTESIREALRPLLSNRGISDALDYCLKSSRITLAYDPPPDGDPLVPVESSDEHGGSYTIVWSGSTCPFSDGLQTRDYLRARLKTFLDAVRFLHKETLCTAFAQLRPLINKQLDIQRTLWDLSKPLVDAKGRWAGKVLVANYGASPMMVWPDAVLTVKHHNSRGKFRIPCYLAQEFSDAPKLRDVDGLLVLAPGEKFVLWAITKDVQEDITDGAIVRTHFSEGNADARVVMKVTRRGAFWGSAMKSNKATFGNNAVLP